MEPSPAKPRLTDMPGPLRLPVLSWIAFALAGLGLLAAALVAAGAGGGTTRGPVPTGPPAPPAGDASPVAAMLRPFEDCGALRDWYVAHAVRRVTAYGWEGQPVYLLHGLEGRRMPLASAPVAGTARADRASSATGTNTQEVDVDEPDVAKTDGDLVVRLHGRTLIVTDVSGTAPAELARHQLPRGLAGAELLLVGDHVVVVASEYRALPLERVPDGRAQPPVGTRVVDLDLSAPAAPVVVADRTYPGTLVSARQYGDLVRLVTAVGPPPLPFAQPDRGLGRPAAVGRNRALVEQTSLGDWLPDVQDNLTGVSEPAVGCGSVYHPGRATGSDTVLVSGFRPGSTDTSSTAVTGDGQTVYSSADRLYVATTPWQQRGWGPAALGPAARTEIHAFRLDGLDATYAGSGEVPGTVRDRWSMDEHDGYLRVATSRTDRRGGARDNARTATSSVRSGLVVLAEHRGALVEVGQVWGLGRREDLQAVRWFDDLAVLVTFRQMDPLYTVDLSAPTRPRVLGALKIPGFSSYLHPIGGDLLLGIGTDATVRGESKGAQAAVFDIHDLADPKRVATVGFGRWTEAEVAWEPRELTWLPAARAAVTAVQDYSPGLPGGGAGGTEIHLLRVGAGGALSDQVLGTVHGGQFRALPLADGRVALVDARVRVVDVR